jgi:RNA polymerase sigma factor (sigma-70 family)
VEQDRSISRREDEAIASARFPTSARLVAGIHHGDEIALREFFLLYAPLLRDQARRMSIDAADHDELVTTLLNDVALHLMERQIVPRHLTRYLVAALRNRARNRHRDSRRRIAARESAYARTGALGELVVAECHSEYGVRTSDAPDHDDQLSTRTSIKKLAETAARELTRDETVMMICIERHVPLREIADQLGITYGAARVRLHRLRARFRKLAIEYLRGLKSDERHELQKFFRRAGVQLAPETAAYQEEKVNGRI